MPVPLPWGGGGHRVGEDSQQPVCGMWKDDNIWFVLPELLQTLVRGL